MIDKRIYHGKSKGVGKMRISMLILSTFLFLFLGQTGLYAQTSILASGGDNSGSGGSVSYSVGQVFYTTNTGTSGSVEQGVQHPFEFYGTPSLIINKPLGQGWTWFSLNVNDGSMNINDVLASLNPTELDYIKNQTESATYYNSTGWDGTLLQLNNTEMYKIKLSQVDQLDFEGVPVDPGTNPIIINTGWNWIGYTPQGNQDLELALIPLNPINNEYIKNQTLSSTYYSGFGWFGRLTDLYPLDGYMLKATSDGILTYPYPGIIPKTPFVDDNITGLDFGPALNTHFFEYNGSLTAKVIIDGNNVGSEDNHLYVFVGNENRGKARGKLFSPTGQYVYNIMIHSNKENNETVSFRFYNNSQDKWYGFSETISFEADMIMADAYDPFELKNGSSLETNFMNDNGFSFEVYPNPFMGILDISFTNPEHQKVRLSLFDSYGRKVRIIEERPYPPGTYNVEWDSQNIPNGMYFIRMETKDYVKNLKVVKVK